MKYLVMLLLFLVGSAHSSNEWNDSVVGFVANRQDDVVLLYKTPCYLAVRNVKALHAAKAVTPTGSYKGCWVEKDGNVFLIWEDGVVGVMHSYEFRLLRQT